MKHEGAYVLAKFSSNARRIATEDRALSPCTADEASLIEEGFHPRMFGHMNCDLGDPM